METPIAKSKNIIIFGFAPLTFDGGFEKIISNLALHLKLNNQVKIITASEGINNFLTIVLSGHKCETRVNPAQIKKRLFNIKLSEIHLTDLFPLTKGFFFFRKEFGNADVIYTNSEIHYFIFIKYFLLCNKKPAIICAIHTPIVYEYAKSLKSRLHNIVYRSFLYKNLIKGEKVNFLVMNIEQKLQVKNNLCKDGRKIRIISNGIDTEKFKPQQKNRGRFFRILFAGRLTEQKGCDLLEKAIIDLSKEKEFRNMEFLFAGTGEMGFIPKRLEKRFSNVKFLGHIENMPDLYNETDLLVVPSRWEAFCFSVAEAQSCKIPVIASDISGPNSIIINGKTGVLIEPENYKRLKAAILEMFNLHTDRPRDYELMGELGRQNILERYSMERINKQIEDFIYEL